MPVPSCPLPADGFPTPRPRARLPATGGRLAPGTGRIAAELVRTERSVSPRRTPTSRRATTRPAGIERR